MNGSSHWWPSGEQCSLKCCKHGHTDTCITWCYAARLNLRSSDFLHYYYYNSFILRAIAKVTNSGVGIISLFDSCCTFVCRLLLLVITISFLSSKLKMETQWISEDGNPPIFSTPEFVISQGYDSTNSQKEEDTFGLFSSFDSHDLMPPCDIASKASQFSSNSQELQKPISQGALLKRKLYEDSNSVDIELSPVNLPFFTCVRPKHYRPSQPLTAFNSSSNFIDQDRNLTRNHKLQSISIKSDDKHHSALNQFFSKHTKTYKASSTITSSRAQDESMFNFIQNFQNLMF